LTNGLIRIGQDSKKYFWEDPWRKSYDYFSLDHDEFGERQRQRASGNGQLTRFDNLIISWSHLHNILVFISQHDWKTEKDYPGSKPNRGHAVYCHPAFPGFVLFL